ncbi:unnamed protein product [Vitrella brassicaformis CCMP3155]|uniref:Uncharacterized protein n=2 Tax=Vitrella brassicaformis TaxID=1169539 RepID=A0A0G4FK38_VITBC|nr:unnamed protein product [Vitrella brassicaformis CCMP3155]|eukprot:CEM14149.1 unnamed protein product [Vitrella brassicaformis CCMP3155]
MDPNKELVANARAVRDGLSRLLDQDQAAITAQASSPVGLALSYQLDSVACLLDTLPKKLQQREPSLTSAVAVDAHTSTTEAAAASGAAHTEPQWGEAPGASGPSYRLIHQSGNAPPVNHQGPARRRLSRDELANVFGHLQHWELTRHRRRLGTPLFHQSAANYTHLVIDCKDDTARRMWETMPLAVAHNWGERATNVREIKHRHPGWTIMVWRRGTWVALVEGHAIGRAAIAEKKRRERDGGQGTAAAPAVAGQGNQSADEGTLEVLSFEAVDLDDSIVVADSIYDPDLDPTSDLPPIPTALVHLPALKTIDNTPWEYLSARLGRKWYAPAVKTIIIDASPCDVDAGETWLTDCEAIEVLDNVRWDADQMADALRGLPADGKSLKALRTLRGIRMDEYVSHAEIDRLREVMVARGVSRSIRELGIDIGDSLWDAAPYREKLRETAQFIDAVAHPAAISEDLGQLQCGKIAVELVSRSRSSGSPTMQKIIDGFAKVAHTVAYCGSTEAIPAAISDNTFPDADTLQLFNDALDDEANVSRAVEIASNMPSLSFVKAGDDEYFHPLEWPADEVWRFLEQLQTVLVSNKVEKTLDIELNLSTAELTAAPDTHDSPCMWGPSYDIPSIGEVTVNVFGNVEDDEFDFDLFYYHVIAMVASFMGKLTDHKSTVVHIIDDEQLVVEFRRRFMPQQAGFNLSGGPYTLSLDDRKLCVRRRNAAT